MKKRLQRWFPLSLRAQMVVLILGIMLMVQAATFATVSWSWRQFTQKVAVELTVTTLRTLRSALEHVPKGERADYVREKSGREWRLWTRSLPRHTRLEHSRKWHRPKAEQSQDHAVPQKKLKTFVDALNEQLQDNTRVALSHSSNPKLYISLIGDDNLGPSDTKREWLVIPLDRVAPSIGTPIIVFWLLGMGLFLILAAAFSWHITRPLSHLAKAADQLAAGKPQHVRPTGPRETRILAQRFNAMQDAVAESNAVQRTLLAGLPHDLKGPLSRMWLRIEMLENPAFQEGMRKDVKDMQQMIDQFIGFVRGSDPASYSFDLIELDDWLVEKVAAWESSGCQIEFLYTNDQPVRIKGDIAALDRLIDNLITNALNHGKEPIEVALTVQGDSVVIQVTDHGSGIQTERQQEALRPFSRLDDARTRTGSVGLGLALADAISRSHQGHLRLDNVAGKGLRVSVYLPKETAIRPTIES